MEHSFMTYLRSSMLLTVPLTLGAFPIPVANWPLLLYLFSQVYTRKFQNLQSLQMLTSVPFQKLFVIEKKKYPLFP